MDTRIPKELELVKLVNEGKQLGKRTWPQKLKYKEKVGAQIVAQVSAKDTTLWAGGGLSGSSLDVLLSYSTFVVDHEQHSLDISA